MPWGHLLHGAILAIGGATEEAVPYLARAQALGESDPHVQLILGLLGQPQGDAGGAIAHLTRALSLQPELLEAMLPLGGAQHE
jgi:Flp pilus assembly protein TadD